LSRRWDQTTHGASLNRVLKKICNAIMVTEVNEELSSLANSYGFLLNVHNNIRKTYLIEIRLRDLERMAALIKK